MPGHTGARVRRDQEEAAQSGVLAHGGLRAGHAPHLSEPQGVLQRK